MYIKGTHQSSASKCSLSDTGKMMYWLQIWIDLQNLQTVFFLTIFIWKWSQLLINDSILLHLVTRSWSDKDFHNEKNSSYSLLLNKFKTSMNFLIKSHSLHWKSYCLNKVSIFLEQLEDTLSFRSFTYFITSARVLVCSAAVCIFLEVFCSNCETLLVEMCHRLNTKP